MANNIREVQEGLQHIGEDERIAYSLGTTNVGGSPTAVSVVAWRERDWSEITGTIFPVSAPTVVGDDIVLSPFVASPTYLDEVIRVEVAFTADGNELEHFFRVQVDR